MLHRFILPQDGSQWIKSQKQENEYIMQRVGFFLDDGRTYVIG